MQIHNTKSSLSASGGSRRLVRYTPEGTGVGGLPAVLFDPQLGTVNILQLRAH